MPLLVQRGYLPELKSLDLLSIPHPNRQFAESGSLIVDLRFAREQGFRWIDFLGDYHVDNPLLRLALR
jgi:hypothetical protein